MNSLLTCIQNELAAMIALVQVLSEEQLLLTQAPSLQQIQTLNVLTRKKNLQIVEVAQQSQTRRQYLSGAGISEADTIHPGWLENTEQQQQWQLLVTQTEKAKELNRVFGLLIAKHLARNQQTLNVLYQHNRQGSNTNLYGPNGHCNIKRASTPGFAAK